MYPDPPYPRYSWSITNHMAKVDDRLLYHILLGASMHRDVVDPAPYVNYYLITNNLLPPNVRSDTGQPDIWRDYQQILSELGLIYSTRYIKPVEITPLGLAYLGKELSYSEVMTLQSIRYQYPNGHNSTIDDLVKLKLSGTSFNQYGKLTELHLKTGVLIRPTILIWRILQALKARGEVATLSAKEIANYAMRCSNHSDVNACVADIVKFRTGVVNYDLIGLHRNALEWIKFIRANTYFVESSKGKIGLSQFSLDNSSQIDTQFLELEKESSFWKPSIFDRDENIGWYAYFGSLDLSISSLPMPDQATEASLSEEDKWEFFGGKSSTIVLREYDHGVFDAFEEKLLEQDRRKIDASYDLKLVSQAHLTHNSMVDRIAKICQEKGARVLEDPSSVDLLIEFGQSEFIVEVKSVTFRNFVAQLRYAIGQVSQYDYLRSLQSQIPRRKIIALVAQIPGDSWCVSFLNDHLDIDLLSLSGQALKVNSSSDLVHMLFGTE